MTITIDEAIKILQLDHDIPGSVAIEEVNEAEQLGIEALTAWRQYRSKKAPANLYLLPGETK